MSIFIWKWNADQIEANGMYVLVELQYVLRFNVIAQSWLISIHKGLPWEDIGEISM